MIFFLDSGKDQKLTTILCFHAVWFGSAFSHDCLLFNGRCMRPRSQDWPVKDVCFPTIYSICCLVSRGSLMEKQTYIIVPDHCSESKLSRTRLQSSTCRLRFAASVRTQARPTLTSQLRARLTAVAAACFLLRSLRASFRLLPTSSRSTTHREKAVAKFPQHSLVTLASTEV